MSFGKRHFKKVNLKWEEIHELKAYLIYRKVKEGLGDKNKLCEELFQDVDFKKADISLSSINMKFENNKYLDTGAGLKNSSQRNKKIFSKYKSFSIEELKNIIMNR